MRRGDVFGALTREMEEVDVAIVAPPARSGRLSAQRRGRPGKDRPIAILLAGPHRLRALELATRLAAAQGCGVLAPTLTYILVRFIT